MNGKPMPWSVYFQNPEYLERTRMFLVPPEMHPLIREWCGLKDGMNVLDVGCGTGYFTRLLAEGGKKVTVTGLDLEKPFIEFAKRRAAHFDPPITFIEGDALNLPFGDETFDLVVSHTFLTSVPDPVRAMDEMKRVTRPGGRIASVTTMSMVPGLSDDGQYPEDCGWLAEYRRMSRKFTDACFSIDPIEPRVAGLNPVRVPRFFAEQGLKKISAWPLGKVFSLSNAAVSPEEKLLYLDLFEDSENKQLDAFMALPEMRAYFTEEDADSYRRLIRERCDWYRERPEENAVWEWQGGANVLVAGIRE